MSPFYRGVTTYNRRRWVIFTVGGLISFTGLYCACARASRFTFIRYSRQRIYIFFTPLCRPLSCPRIYYKASPPPFSHVLLQNMKRSIDCCRLNGAQRVNSFFFSDSHTMSHTISTDNGLHWQKEDVCSWSTWNCPHRATTSLCKSKKNVSMTTLTIGGSVWMLFFIYVVIHILEKFRSVLIRMDVRTIYSVNGNWIVFLDLFFWEGVCAVDQIRDGGRFKNIFQLKWNAKIFWVVGEGDGCQLLFVCVKWNKT